MSINEPHFLTATSRRDFLMRAGAGFAGLAFASLLARDRSVAAMTAHRKNPIAPKPPQFPARATNVIWCFIDGGPSHIDLFDPKPALTKLDGKPLPDSFVRPVTAMGKTAYTPLLASQRKFKQHGQSGIWVSDWYPEIATLADEMAVIRSCQADGLNHVGGICQMNTGSILGGRPCLGSWSIYGLGSECENLPGFIVMLDNPEDPPGGNRNWGTGFMPTTFQGTKFRDGKAPILHVSPPDEPATLARSLSESASLAFNRQRSKLDFIQELNAQHRASRIEDSDLEARIAAYELAYRVQSSAPEAVDLSTESAETQRLYGLDRKETARNGRNCLLARRLVERGVRFVQLYMGSGSKWDAHSNVEGNHSQHCRETDRPITGLVKDLKRRGLLESTLVIWGGEFGRTPMSESGNGRDHNPYGFTIWMAGGGIRGGAVYGATDEIGLYAVENKAHVHDIHATILYLLGLDHESLTFSHNGRDERLTITSGSVIEAIVA
jgi:hypothetical protein